jgi:hypothetical protein
MITHCRRNEKIVFIEHVDTIKALEDKRHENRYRLAYFPRELWENKRTSIETYLTA